MSIKKLYNGLPVVVALLLLIIPLSLPSTAHAADIRAGNDLIFSANQKNLKDLYLFGSTVQVDAPVTNDVVAAGGTITISNSVSNSITAAGGDITIHGKVGNTVRVAGGNIIIDGPITNDLVVGGGNVTVGKNATIGGDVIAAGGQIMIDGPVHGKILMTGGNITLNSTVGGGVTTRRVGTLTLGPQAKIAGNLTYYSPQPAQKEQGSKVIGITTYTHIDKHPRQQQQFAQAAIWTGLYRLVVDIILSILFIYFFRRGLLTVCTRMQESFWKSGGTGLTYVILMPLVSVLLLIFIWLGFVSFFFYALSLIIGAFISNVFVGWFLMRWWATRERHAYVLDWKAGVIGPIVLFILLLIPVLGWLTAAIIFFVATGALISEFIALVPRLQETTKRSKLN